MHTSPGSFNAQVVDILVYRGFRIHIPCYNYNQISNDTWLFRIFGQWWNK